MHKQAKQFHVNLQVRFSSNSAHDLGCFWVDNEAVGHQLWLPFLHVEVLHDVMETQMVLVKQEERGSTPYSCSPQHRHFGAAKEGVFAVLKFQIC